MVYIEAEVSGSREVAELMRLALGGEAFQDRPPVPELPSAPEIPARAALGGEAFIPSQIVKQAPEPAPVKRAYTRKAKPGSVSKLTKPATAATDGRMPADGPSAKILALLAKKPMSSGELITASRLESGSVYTACGNLKTAGRIESRTDDDGDGTRRYYLIQNEAKN
jgi:hypothetical protein